MMKTIIDQQTGKAVSINYIPSSAMAVMCCGTVYLTTSIRPADRSLAAVAYTKNDLEAFGSFFNQ